MSKRKTAPAAKFVNPADAVEAVPTPESGPSLRRVMVLISEKDLQDMREHFLQGKAGNPLVAVHAPASQPRPLTDAQREKRKAYRQRPEVKEKQKAYRTARAQRIRAALQATS